MATSISKSSIFIAFLWLLLLLSSINGVQIMEEDYHCKFPSTIWKGICLFTDECHTQCRLKEGALEGGCERFECWCQYSCQNLCARLSGTWKGPCLSDVLCNRQCREKENSFRGRSIDFQCWCTYNC